MSDLRKELIRLAHENPELRDALLPLLEDKTAMEPGTGLGAGTKANDEFYQWGRWAQTVTRTFERQIQDPRYTRQFWSNLSESLMQLSRALEEIGTDDAERVARSIRRAGAEADRVTY